MDHDHTEGTLRLVLGDQLSLNLSSLRDIDKETDTVLMAEVIDECTYVRHHPKKIALILSGMRHFAEELRSAGIRVLYRRLDDAEAPESLIGVLDEVVNSLNLRRVAITEPGEWRLLDALRTWREDSATPVDFLADDRFVVSLVWFRSWAEGRKQLRMEDFYREVRRQTGLLMEEGLPVGGQWNFDKENRKSIKGDVDIPGRAVAPADDITQEVLTLVEGRFGDHFGALHPFQFAVTRRAAEKALNDFITHHLPSFGDYQDAMLKDEPFMFHSVISMYINMGLLDPLEACRKAEEAFYTNHAPINAVEGFIRQIIGWREYVRGIYWLHMPEYAETNTFKASRSLPSFYWGDPTDMVCIRECVGQTREHGYAHHIQRLMVTGNFALLAGLEPKQVQDWYLAVYIDAFEWVELPNTHGMALFADNGVMATKPYAAGGRYIDKMSDYCGACRFNPKDPAGENACPFSFLYWHFLERNRGELSENHRLRTVYSSLDRMDPARVSAIMKNAEAFLDELDTNQSA